MVWYVNGRVGVRGRRRMGRRGPGDGGASWVGLRGVEVPASGVNRADRRNNAGGFALPFLDEVVRAELGENDVAGSPDRAVVDLQQPEPLRGWVRDDHWHRGRGGRAGLAVLNLQET